MSPSHLAETKKNGVWGVVLGCGLSIMAASSIAQAQSAGPVVDYDLQGPVANGTASKVKAPSGPPMVAYDIAPARSDITSEPQTRRAQDRPASYGQRSQPAASSAEAGADTGESNGVVATSKDRETAQRLSQKLTGQGFGKPSTRHATNDADDRKALAAFYASDDGRPLFVRDGALTPSGTKLIETLKSASDWGLGADDFADDIAVAGLTTDDDITLSLAALKYARHARGGRIANPTKDLSSYLDKKPRLITADEVVAALASTDDVGQYLTSLHPQTPEFRNLRKALLKLRTEHREAPKVVEIPRSGPLLSQGKTHPHVALLRERLGVSLPTTDDGAPGDPEYFDASLVAALKAFQTQSGLSADGVVGRKTRAAFAVGPREVSEDMLVANMEMWRWMPDDLGALHVTANIPEYKVRVFKNDRVLYEERVIVGKTNKQTPVFSDVMERIVFNPKWGVPNSIKVNELLPSLARGGTAFERQNLRLSYKGRNVDPRSVNWAQADIRNYHVYQPPGRGNVLGVVKFLFPNKHAVYMHDTPTKPLFNKPRRTYSHGCVRVRNPMKLAKVLLDADRSWPAGRVASMVGGSRENHVTMDTKIPVHIVYQTAVADADGNVTTFPDIYSHEKRLRLALAGEWKKVPRHRDHMLPVRIDRAKIDRLVRNNQQFQNPVNNIFEAIFGF
ncbi:MAG: L,D-transpeptidase family protein [Pseudomonadota bacterium]